MFEQAIQDDTRRLAVEFKNVILLILTVIDLVFIFLSTVTFVPFKVENVFADYDFFVCILLFIDLMYDFYNSNKSMKEFFIKDKNILALFSLFPFDLLFRYFSVFRIFRFLKIIKVVRVWNVKKDISSLNYFIHYHLFRLLFILLMIYVAVASGLLIILEDSVTNIGDAFYFIVITATTVGYGDITPMSSAGKALSILTILIGIIFVAVLTAHLTNIYNQQDSLKTRATLRKSFDKTRKIVTTNKQELDKLHNRITELENENMLLHEKIDKMNENIEKLIEK